MVVGSFRLIIAGGVILVLMLTSLLGWLLVDSRPTINRLETGIQALQDQQTAMLDQETGVRAFLISGQPTFLEPYRRAQAALAGIDHSLLAITGTDTLTASVVSLQIAEQRWIDAWAMPAASGQRVFPALGPALNTFLDQGKALFDDYRAAHARTTAMAMHRLDSLRHQQITVLEAVTALAVLIALVKIVIGISLRNRLQRRILAPIDVLLAGLADVHAGRLEQHLSTEGPAELSEVLAGFNTMTQSLATARDLARSHEQRISEQADKLRGVLSMTREIGGSLNSGYVLAAITDGVVTISGARRATVWLQDDTGALTCAWNSQSRDSPEHAGDLLTASHVATAAKFGRTTLGHASDNAAHRLAVPLIVGARVIGVLELELAPGRTLSDEDIDVVETLSVHAATAIQATRLHAGTTHASEHDALTGLANRRRLEADFAAEVDRSKRYGNPLSFIMLDLDHFKRLNDTHGHQRGDEVLQGCAAAITAALRTTDTAYRYGGEELAVLARETSIEAGLQLAERLRAAIEARYPGTGGTLHVTASLGVADMPACATSPAGLTRAADTALYAAKRTGRNRVHRADPTGPRRLPTPGSAELPSATRAELGPTSPTLPGSIEASVAAPAVA